MNRTTSPTASTAQDKPGKIITTEQLLAGLHPYYSETGNPVEEPHIPLNKANSIIAALYQAFDDETGEMLLSGETLNWCY